MPICQNCHNKWTWKETFKKTSVFISGMTCSYCNEKQYVTARTKKISAIFPVIIIFMLFLSNLYFGPSYIVYLGVLTLIFLYVILNPFFVKLSNEEKPLF